jgi:hypothetical protein
MKLQISKVSIDTLSPEKFVDEYLKPEKPVLLTGLSNIDTEILTPEYVKQNFADESKREAGWYDANIVDEGCITIPEIVRNVMDRQDMAVRAAPMRLFMQPGGHVTLPHYDGNSLHGFNQQVVGKKRWIITSPNTPLPNIPFMFAGLVGKNFNYSEEKHDFMEFETNPGEILFLPRYWYHEVHSLGEVNLNVNWVCTPTYPNASSILGKREVEIVKLRKTLPFINNIFFPDKFDNYGGQGKTLIDTYSQGVSSGQMLGRLFREILSYPKLFILAKQIRERANEFSSNNFNIK